MRVCAFDIETDGLCFEKSRVTELAWMIKDVGDPKHLELNSIFIHDSAFPPTLTDEIKGITKITEKHLDLAHACTLGLAFESMMRDFDDFNVDAFVGHYAYNFDRPFILAKMKQQYIDENYGREISMFQHASLIDTKEDIEFPPSFTSHSLIHLGAHLGFINPFPHSALFDVAATLKVLESFDVEKAFARSKEPWVVLRAETNYDQRELAKKRRYRWENLGDKVYKKQWVKRVKACDVEKEKKEANFTVTILE